MNWVFILLIVVVVLYLIRVPRVLRQYERGVVFFLGKFDGRLGALAVLGAIPSARIVTFRWEGLRMARWETALWIVGIVLFDRYVCGWIRRTINAALPATVLGVYPELHGWLHIVEPRFRLGQRDGSRCLRAVALSGPASDVALAGAKLLVRIKA